MNCPKCGCEMEEFNAICPNCGNNILRDQFYEDGETSYRSEQELIDAVYKGEVRFSFMRSDSMHLASTEKRILSIFPMVASTILSIILIIICFVLHDFSALVAIPIIFAISLMRTNMGYLFAIGAVVGYFLKAPKGLIIGAAACVVIRILYHYWMGTCDKAAQKVILDNMDEFYIMWYNQKAALRKNGEILIHTEKRSQ